VRLEAFVQKEDATDMQLSRFEDCMQNVACWADRIKVVWWDGSGICLFAKTIEETRFCWPKIAPTRVQLNHAQLLALVDGLDWTKVRPVVVKRPQSVG
jgi:transposase